MNIKSTNISIGYISVETGLWHIKRYLMGKYGVAQSERDMYPLQWYVYTGRASADFLKLLLNAKPFMIARKLHEGGSDHEIIERIKHYLNY